jgi:Tol biopolymer transport system component
MHRVAYVTAFGKEERLWMWAPATGETIEIGGAAYEYFWAPDGQHIAYTEGTLYSGEPPLYVADLAGNTLEIGPTINGSFAWSPDGTQLVYADLECKLHLIRSDGSGDYVLADLSTEPEVNEAGGGSGGKVDWIDRFIREDRFL